MKFRAALILFLLSSCEQSKTVVIEKWSNGNPKQEIRFENVEDSIFTKTEYYESGKTKSTKEFVNGRLYGKLINYSETGYKQQEFDYKYGVKNGIGTAWYESGKIAFQFKYENGEEYDGTEYFENGWPRVLVRFSSPGKREGKALYYKENGWIWLEGFFKDGKEDSVWTEFTSTGSIKEIKKFKAGELVEQIPKDNQEKE